MLSKTLVGVWNNQGLSVQIQILPALCAPGGSARWDFPLWEVILTPGPAARKFN